MKPKKYFTLSEIRICCVYFLFRDGKLIYIGQSIDLHSRLISHLFTTKHFDSFRYIACSPESVVYYERRLIRYFKPMLNIQYSGNKPAEYYAPERPKKEGKTIERREPKPSPVQPKIQVRFRTKYIKIKPVPVCIPVLTPQAIENANKKIASRLV
jgi:hypothetical protein